jgi:ABC-2 type transport system permease protein
MLTRSASLTRYIRLYAAFLSLHFRRLAEYRGDFLIGATALIISQTAGLLFIWVVFTRIESLAGWNVFEVTLLYGLATGAASLARLFFSNLWSLGTAFVRRGDLLRLLIRPVNPLFHLIAEHFEEQAIGGLALALGLVGHSLNGLGMGAELWRWAVALLTMVCGAFIVGGINLAVASLSFWMARL